MKGKFRFLLILTLFLLVVTPIKGDDKQLWLIEDHFSVSGVEVTPSAPLAIAAGNPTTYTDSMKLWTKSPYGASRFHSVMVSVTATQTVAITASVQNKHRMSNGNTAWHTIITAPTRTITGSGNWCYNLSIPVCKWTRLSFSSDATYPVTFTSIGLARE